MNNIDKRHPDEVQGCALSVLRVSPNSFNFVLGFHGSHWTEQPDTIDTLEDYITGAKFNDIGSNWIDLHYEEDYGYCDAESEWTDQCPSIGCWGSSASECNSYYNYGGFKDFKNTGDHDIGKAYGIGGCNGCSAGNWPS